MVWIGSLRGGQAIGEAIKSWKFSYNAKIQFKEYVEKFLIGFIEDAHFCLFKFQQIADCFESENIWNNIYNIFEH